jgi:hypothetical protein
MIVSAIGLVHYEPAVPALLALLPHEYDQIRRTAARSLGELRATLREHFRGASREETDVTDGACVY